MLNFLNSYEKMFGSKPFLSRKGKRSKFCVFLTALESDIGGGVIIEPC